MKGSSRNESLDFMFELWQKVFRLIFSKAGRMIRKIITQKYYCWLNDDILFYIAYNLIFKSIENLKFWNLVLFGIKLKLCFKQGGGPQCDLDQGWPRAGSGRTTQALSRGHPSSSLPLYCWGGGCCSRLSLSAWLPLALGSSAWVTILYELVSRYTFQTLQEDTDHNKTL